MSVIGKAIGAIALDVVIAGVKTAGSLIVAGVVLYGVGATIDLVRGDGKTPSDKPKPTPVKKRRESPFPHLHVAGVIAEAFVKDERFKFSADTAASVQSAMAFYEDYRNNKVDVTEYTLMLVMEGMLADFLTIADKPVFYDNMTPEDKDHLQTIRNNLR